jgi:hypothetical protein
MAIPEYKTGDTSPDITGTVSDANGPVNIFGATSIRFIAKAASGSPIAGTAVKIDDGTVPLRGKWKYVWGASDLAVAGSYEVEIEVTWSAGKIETFPNAKGRNPTFVVTDDLD